MYGEFPKRYSNILLACPCCVCINGLHANILLNSQPGQARQLKLQQFGFNKRTTVSLHQRGSNNLTTDLLRLPRPWQIYRLLYKATSECCAWMHATIKSTGVDRHALNKDGTRSSTVKLHHTRPLPPLDLTRSSIKGKLALNSVKPSRLPSRMGSQLALRMP